MEGLIFEILPYAWLRVVVFQLNSKGTGASFKNLLSLFLSREDHLDSKKALINGKKYYTNEYDFFHTFTHFSKK